ncbi:MAG TPA: ATP synthase F1 subunit delta [Alphaproteobacteria bacterium]|nr:ATP synthase F1 subunit delta [Alphaproteobacteria bacterium]
MSLNDLSTEVPDTTLLARYAKAALFTSKNIDLMFKEMEILSDLLQKNAALKKCLIEPCMQRSLRLELLIDLLKDLKFQDSTKRFLELLMTEKRFSKLFMILQKCKELYAIMCKSYPVKVVVSSNLKESKQAQLEHTIKETFQDVGAISYEIDEDILGGFKIFYKDNQIDFSLQGQFSKAASCLSTYKCERG